MRVWGAAAAVAAPPPLHPYTTNLTASRTSQPPACICCRSPRLQCAKMGAYKATQPAWKNFMLAVAAGCYTAMFG